MEEIHHQLVGSISIIRENKRLPGSWERKEVPLSPLLRKPQTCAGNDVARQPPTSISFETRCSYSLVEWNIRLKAQEREEWFACWWWWTCLHPEGHCSLGQLQGKSGVQDRPYTYQILEGFFLSLSKQRKKIFCLSEIITQSNIITACLWRNLCGNVEVIQDKRVQLPFMLPKFFFLLR